MKFEISPKARTLIKSLIAIFLPIFSILFLVTATTIIIIVMQGYAIDIRKKEIIKTGVLNVETHPEEASITVNDQYVGKSNKAIPNLRVGSYTVKLERSGYFTYQRKIEILHGLASPVVAPLIRDNTHTVLLEKSATKTALIAHTEEAYYVLTETKRSAGKITYTLDMFSSVKSLFDDPVSKQTKVLTVFSLESLPVKSFIISPSGKTILFRIEDAKTKIPYISVVPLSNQNEINLNLTENKSLSLYAKDSKTTIHWAQDSDYLLISTPAQIISYNISSGTRIILLDKDADNGAPLWDETETGISILRKTGGTEAPVYELSTVSFNGNPLDITIPLSLVTLKSQPTALWSYMSPSELPIHVINTKDGAYLIGQLYTTKTGEYAVSTSSEKVGTTDIVHFESVYSLIQMSEKELTARPAYLLSKFAFAFSEESDKSVSLFYYNKRAADALTVLGKKTVHVDADSLTGLMAVSNDYYIAFRKGSTLSVTDLTGENVYRILDNVTTYALNQNDTAIFFTTSEGELCFRVIQ